MLLLQALYIEGGGYSAKQQMRHVQAYVVSMQRHIHMHKNLQRAMYRTWQKKTPAQANRRKIAIQPQNSNCNSNRLVQH